MWRKAAWGLLVCGAVWTGCGDDAQEPEPELPIPEPPSPCQDEEGPDQDSDDNPDACDNCPNLPNPDQEDSDHDGTGDACQDDDDKDGALDTADNCPKTLHPDQRDTDGDGLGDACDPCPNAEDQRDADGDDLDDCEDLCPGVASASNADGDGDGIGDACDLCPQVADAQRDSDKDGSGDACDPDPGPFNVEEATVADIHRALLGGDTTCAEVVEQALDRIQRYDLDLSDGPPINAFVSFNLKVREQARALDEHLADTGELIGPLHCAPLVIKDLYDSSDTPTSSGTLAFIGIQAPDDGFAVGRMRQQGAILLSTTTMDELSKGVFSTSSRSGRTGNAYNPGRNSGGSSSGSGASVGASFAVLGTGTDNCASLTLPASYNGLVTVRPTLGLISLDGVVPSNRLDATAGPMTRTVGDMALMLDQMAGTDPNDKRTANVQRPDTYTAHLKLDGLQGKRVGVLRSHSDNLQDSPTYTYGQAPPDAQRVFQRSLRELERLGATVVDNLRLPNLNAQRSGAGFGQDIQVYLDSVDSPFETYADICATERYSNFVYDDAASCVQSYQWSLQNASEGSAVFEGGQERYRNNREYLVRVMDALDLDALIYPSDAQGGALVDRSLTNCVITSVTGLPSMIIQAGAMDDGMPVGMMLLGRAWSEPVLLEMAYAYEQGTHHRRPPTLTSAIPADAPLEPMDLAEANAIRLRLGEAAFEQVLQDGERWELTPSVFTNIARGVLEE